MSILKKAVIFDLDGVIVSTDNFHYYAWKTLTDREHIYFDKSINNRLRGVSRRESLEIILEKSQKNYSEDQILEMLDFKNNIYKKSLINLSNKDILNEFNELYTILRKNKVKLAIGSSSKNTRTILKYIGLINAFDVIVDGNDITKSKPNPEVFLLAAEKLEVNPVDCYVIEDAIAGIEAAKAGNMQAIAISDARKSNIADYRVDNLMEIKEIILGGKE